MQNATVLAMKLRDRADREKDPLVSARLHSIANLSSVLVLERHHPGMEHTDRIEGATAKQE